MRMTNNSYEKMNILTAMCFDANAVFDNLAYNLEYSYFTNLADIVHHKIAHLMPVLADEVTDMMLLLSARPVRRPIAGYNTEYHNLNDILGVLKNTLESLRDATKGLIESADMEDDDEVRIFAENFLKKILPLIKQSEEWLHVISVSSDQELNTNVTAYTHFIKM